MIQAVGIKSNHTFRHIQKLNLPIVFARIVQKNYIRIFTKRIKMSDYKAQTAAGRDAQRPARPTTATLDLHIGKEVICGKTQTKLH
jgi:hypothetical protein